MLNFIKHNIFSRDFLVQRSDSTYIDNQRLSHCMVVPGTKILNTGNGGSQYILLL